MKNVRIIDEAAYFNSQPESTSSPSKGRNRDGQPPPHKGGGKGDRGGGGAGAGGASGAAGGFAGGKGPAASGSYPTGEKGGSANAKASGGDNYSSHNRPQNRNAAMAAAMQAAMGGSAF